MGAQLRRLNTPERRAWWVSFAILFSLGVLWALANPPTAASDEPAHIVHAEAVARGDFFGRPLSAAQLAEFPNRYYIGSNQGGVVDVYRSVNVPEIYDRPNPICYINHPELSAACLNFTGPHAVTGIVSHTTKYPPAWYAWVGLAARLVSEGSRAGT